jgi:hypothetical protein
MDVIERLPRTPRIAQIHQIHPRQSYRHFGLTRRRETRTRPRFAISRLRVRRLRPCNQPGATFDPTPPPIAKALQLRPRAPGCPPPNRSTPSPACPLRFAAQHCIRCDGQSDPLNRRGVRAAHPRARFRPRQSSESSDAEWRAPGHVCSSNRAGLFACNQNDTNAPERKSHFSPNCPAAVADANSAKFHRPPRGHADFAPEILLRITWAPHDFSVGVVDLTIGGLLSSVEKEECLTTSKVTM